MQASILIIEDDKTILGNLNDLLSVYGYDPEPYENAEEAILRYNEKRFDLVLCDHFLGSTTGIEVLKKIRLAKPEMYVPFIMITANDDKQLYRKAMLNGADDFIHKPFRSVDLIEALERQLEKVNFWRSRLEALANFPHENPNPVVRIDNTHFSIHFSNPAFSKKYESLDDTTKVTLHRFLAEKAQDSIANRAVSVHPFQTQDEHFNVTFAPQIIKGYTNIYFSDITPLVHAENTLKQTETFYKEILDNLPADIAVFDKDKKYLYVNPKGIKDTEIRKWIIGKTDEDYIQRKNITDKSVFVDRYKAFDQAKKTQTDTLWIDEHHLPNEKKRYVLRKFHPVKSESIDSDLMIGYGVDITERIEAEKALEKSRSRYKVLFDNNPQMVFIVNAKGIIMEINSAGVKHLGYNESELIGNSILGVFPDDKHNKVLNTLDICFKNPQIQHEWEAVKKTKDGDLMHVYEVAKCISFEDHREKLLLIVCTDITEKKNNEILLEESNELNKMLLEEMPVPVAIVNQGFITDYNKAFHKLFGYEEKELLGSSLLSLTLPNYQEMLVNKIEERYKASIKVMTCELEMYTKTQNTLNIIINGTLFSDKGQTYTLAVFNDITEIRKAQQREKAAEKLAKTILNASLDAVIMVNNKGEVLDWNSQAETIFGYSEEEAKGENIIDLIVPSELKSTYQKDLNRYFKTGKGPALNTVREVYARNKNGKNIPVEMFVVLIKINQKMLFTGFLRDISVRKESENNLKLLAAELGKQNEELRRFAYITSHDLRAPVINLNSLLTHYDSEDPASELNVEIIKRFKTSSQRIYDTLNDLLEVTRIKDKTNTEEYADIDVKQIFYHCVDDNEQSLIKAGAKVIANFGQETQIKFNKAVINSVFTNLITNAIKYRSLQRPLIIQCSSELIANKLIIKFGDNGMGMDMEKTKNRLFTLYQRFHNHVEGKGLGLYLVKTQLEALGGKLEVESNIDQGTSFTITIPQTKK